MKLREFWTLSRICLGLFFQRLVEQATLDIRQDGLGSKHERMENYGVFEIFRAFPNRTGGWEDDKVHGRAVGGDGNLAEFGLGRGEIGEELAAGPHFFGSLAGVEPCGPGAVVG